MPVFFPKCCSPLFRAGVQQISIYCRAVKSKAKQEMVSGDPCQNKTPAKMVNKFCLYDDKI